jgi:hypothetical protein
MIGAARTPAVIVAAATTMVIAATVVATVMFVARAIIGAASTRRGRRRGCRKRGRAVADVVGTVIEPATVALVLDEIVGTLAHEGCKRLFGSDWSEV